MARKKASVTWQDGNTNPYSESYRTRNGNAYSDTRADLGLGERHSGENGSEPHESFNANPDAMSDEEAERRVPSHRGNAQPSAEQIIGEEAKKTFTPKQLEIWNLLMVEEYTQDEVADHLNVSQKVVSTHLSAARKKFKAYCRANAHRIKRD